MSFRKRSPHSWRSSRSRACSARSGDGWIRNLPLYEVQTLETQIAHIARFGSGDRRGIDWLFRTLSLLIAGVGATA
jgi:hypothetical protein